MSKLISKIVVPDSNEATGYSLYNVKDSGAIHSSDVGVAGGVASLDNAGKVPSSQLPSYVDDVVEGYYHENKFYTTYTPGQEEEDPGTYSGEITAETGKIYVDIQTNQSYRWSGSAYIVISSPYVLPTASANTLGGVKVGDNLSIDQNGVLSAAAAANEVQIGGETPSSSSDVEIFIDTTEDAIAEVYTKQQQDGKFVVIKDLNAAPTSSTLTYTENGTVKNFKQGDEVRVPDAEADNGYTFYKLYELTTSGNTTTATWDKLGAGGGAPVNPNETVNISLTQVGGNSDDLTGASVTITDDDSHVTLLSETWNNETISTEITPNTNYTITVGSISGYVVIQSKSYQADYQNTRNVVFSYAAIGTFIEATDGMLYTAAQWPSTGKTASSVVFIQNANFTRRIPVVHDISKSMHSNATDSISGYITSQSYEQGNGDVNGEKNTNEIINYNIAYGTNTISYCAPTARQTVFIDGKVGYIGAKKEIRDLISNATSINQCLNLIGSSSLNENYITSTISSPDCVFLTNAGFSYTNMTTAGPYLILGKYL